MTNQEIDALIAEKVMGWVRKGSGPSLWVGTDDEVKWWVKHWAPSEDMRQAMQVARHLLGEGFASFEVSYHDDGEHRGWSSYIGRIAGEHWGWGDTPELAICKAALKAKGVNNVS